jgi:hypothetical protein
MKGNLPIELWLNIIDILGLQGYTRDCTNLINALGLPLSLVYKYLVTELFKNRSWWGNYDPDKNYNDQMIDFWKRTGIDDGIPIGYLINNLNSYTRMYKTIWAYSVFTNKNGKYKVFYSNLFDFLRGSHNYKEEYTDCIFKDNRSKSKYIMYWPDLSKKSKRKIEYYLEDLKNVKKITHNGYSVYDLKTKTVLCKVKGSLI